MHNISLRIFQVLTSVLIVALAISTFVVPEDGASISPERSGAGWIKALRMDHFYDSDLNLILWVALSVSMLLSIFLRGMRSLAQKILHLILVIIFLLVIYDKTVNQRAIIQIREGQKINFGDYVKIPDPGYDISLQLLKFEIQRHSGSSAPSAFNSWLLINDIDTTLLTVNKPVAVGRYRLFQSAYDQEYLLEVISASDTMIAPFNTKICLNEKEIYLRGYDDSTHTIHFEIDGQTHRIPSRESRLIAGQKIQIIPLGSIFTSVIEVADVTGTNILALFGLLYLLVLAYNLWWNQSNNP